MLGNVRLDQKTYQALMTNLRELPRRVGLRVLRIGLNAWGGVVKKEAQSRARKQTGLLRKSLTVKVRIPDASYNVKHHGKPAYVMVGPARDVVGPVARVKGASKLLSIKRATKLVLSGGTVETRRPSRYAHLIERGHGGPRPAPAYPFIEPAIRVGETAGMDKLAEKITQGVAAEAAKLSKV